MANKPAVTKRSIDWNLVWPLVGLIMALLLFIFIRTNATVVICSLLISICVLGLLIHIVSVNTNKSIWKMKLRASGIVLFSFVLGFVTMYYGLHQNEFKARRIYVEDKVVLKAILSEHPGKIESLEAQLGDTNSLQFASDWYDILKLSGWEVPGSGPGSISRGGQVIRGAEIIVRDDSTMDTSEVGELRKALQFMRVDPIIGLIAADVPEGKIRLNVGVRRQN